VLAVGRGYGGNEQWAHVKEDFSGWIEHDRDAATEWLLIV
jgi:hypothetical protein